MSIRNDIEIDWSQSPRIITILAPSTTCSVQDLYDTLRYLESESGAMDDKPTVSGSGKEEINDIESVGLTISLLNAVIGFEARIDWTQCELSGGNIVAYNTSGDKINPINPTPFVNITRIASSSATFVTIGENGALTPTQHEILTMTEYQNKAVYINTELGVNGIGTATDPFNNVTDATDFAETHGIQTVYIYSEVEIDRNVKNFTVIGIGSPVVNCNGQDLKNTEFIGCELRGAYSDAIKATKCILGAGFYLNGGFKDCSVISNLTCVDGGLVTMKDCFSNVANNGVSSISLNGLGSSKLVVEDFSGDLVLSDVNSINDLVKVNSNSHLTILPSCTDGDIFVSGYPKVEDESNGSNVDISAVINTANMAKEVWEYTL